MSENDTERLLRECDAGTRMAAGSIRNLLCKVENAELRELLCETLKTHEKLGNDIHAMLNNAGEPAKEPSRMAQAIGDSILTTSGFFGVVIDIMDEVVIVEFGNNKNCRIPMKKENIVEIDKQNGEE